MCQKSADACKVVLFKVVACLQCLVSNRCVRHALVSVILTYHWVPCVHSLLAHVRALHPIVTGIASRSCKTDVPCMTCAQAKRRDNDLEAQLVLLLEALPHLSPVMATGHVVMASFMDAMLCQVWSGSSSHELAQSIAQVC